MQIKKLASLSFVFFTSLTCLLAQDIHNNPSSNHGNKFEQPHLMSIEQQVAHQVQNIGNKEQIMISKPHWMKKN